MVYSATHFLGINSKAFETSLLSDQIFLASLESGKTNSWSDKISSAAAFQLPNKISLPIVCVETENVPNLCIP